MQERQLWLSGIFDAPFETDASLVWKNDDAVNARPCSAEYL